MEDQDKTKPILETILDHTHILVAYLDPQFNFVRVNRAYAEADGQEPSYFPGKNHFDLYPNAENEEIFRCVIETGEPYFAHAKPFEYVDHPERGVTYWDWSLVPAKDPEGIVKGLVFTLMDVTGRARAEEALRESEERYRVIAKNFPNGAVVSFDHDLRYTVAHGAVLEQVGLSSDMMIEKTIRELLPPDRYDELEPHYRAALNGESHAFEYLFADRIFEVHTLPITDADKNVVAGMSISQDITERKQAEEELKIRARILESMAEGVNVSDENALIFFTNPAFDAMFGYERGELVGKHVSILNAGSLEDSERIAGEILEQLKAHGVWSGELNNVKKGGTSFTTYAYVTALEVSGKQYWITVQEDITERKRAEEARQLDESRLEALLKLSHMTEASLQQIADFALEQAIELTQSKVGFLGFMDRDEAVMAIHAWSKDAMEECHIVDQPLHYPIDGAGLWGEAVRQRRALVVNDYSAPDPSKKGYPDGHVHLSRLISLPVFEGDRIVAVAAVGNKEEEYDQLDVRQMTLLLDSMWRIVQRQQAEEALHRSLEETARGQRLLLALSQAAQAVQSARTPDEVYQTIGDEIVKLDYHAIILDRADETHLIVSHHTFDLAVLQTAEKLSGLAAQGFRIAVKPGSLYDRTLTGGQTVFFEDVVELMAEPSPTLAHPLVGRIATLLGLKQAIYAPLTVGDEPHGMLIVTGLDLTEADVPAVTAFANQAAIAIENARLFEQVRLGRERLQALSRQLLQVQEKERRRIARELHDEIGQILTGLNLLLEVSVRAPADTIGVRLGEARAVIEELMEKVDELSLNLRPAMLDDLGLLPTLLWHVERYAVQTGVHVKLEHTGLERRFASEVETATYRVVQEGLTNVARHAGVSEATVRLWADQATLSVQVEDQGIGFDPQNVLNTERTSGLSGMHERAALLGGQRIALQCACPEYVPPDL